MLSDFIANNRGELIRRCRAKVEARSPSPATPAEFEDGVPRFLNQLVATLRDGALSRGGIDSSAALHGRDLQGRGFSIAQVVHDYGNVCQSITDLAVEAGMPISVTEFRTLNGCLDDAIASAVTAFASEEPSSRGTGELPDQRFGFLVHEIRNLVNTATLAFEVLSTGDVGVKGSTGSVLKRTLAGLREVINGSVSDVRLRQGLPSREPILVAALVDELAPAAALEAADRGLRLTVHAGEAGVGVSADRRILGAVVVNLLQNAFKFTRPGTNVDLRVTARAERVHIEVEDECGGLADDNVQALFRPFEQRHADRTGLGLGLAFSRWGAEVHDGRLTARNRPGHGCVFTIDLPRVALAGREEGEPEAAGAEPSGRVRRAVVGQPALTHPAE